MSARPLVRLVCTCLILAALCTGVAMAATGAGKVTAFKATYSSRRPASASGYTLLTKGTPPPPGTQEPNAARVIVDFAPGTRFDTRAVPECHATSAQLVASGAEGACAHRTRIGSGAADGVVAGTPTHFDVVAYNFPHRVWFAGEQGGKPLKRGFFGVYAGRRLTIDVPTLGGAIAPTRFFASIKARARGYMTTPRACPRSLRWRIVARFTGTTSASGGQPVGPVQRRTTTTPCVR